MGSSEQGEHAIHMMSTEEERRYPPSAEFAAQANAKADIYERDFDEFWNHQCLLVLAEQAGLLRIASAIWSDARPFRMARNG